MKDTVHMLLEGTKAELIAKLVPCIYRKYIWHNRNGKSMIYIQNGIVYDKSVPR